MARKTADSAEQSRDWDGICRRSFDISIRAIDEEKRTVEVVASTDTLDGHGDVVEQTFDLKRFKKNPVVLWNHGPGYFCDDPAAEIPIGKAEKCSVKDGQLEATIRFATAAVTPLAEQVWQGFREDVIRAVSIGFRPHDVSREVDDDVEVYHLSNNELFEISVVPIPSNPDAVAKSLASERAGLSKLLAAKSAAETPVDVTDNNAPADAASGPNQTKAVTMDVEQFKAALETAKTEANQLRSDLGAAHQKALDAGSRVTALETENTRLSTELMAEKALSIKAAEELKSASERAATAEAQLVDSGIGELVGKKLTPAEKDEYVALAKSVGLDRVKALLANRPDLTITAAVVVDGKSIESKPAPAPTATESAPLGDAGQDIANMALKSADDALKAQASNPSHAERVN